MSMFCYQCQEALNCTGCTVSGACGKRPSTANLQDLLIYVTKGVALVAQETDQLSTQVENYIIDALFTTVTNTNFDDDAIRARIREGLTLRDTLREKLHPQKTDLHDCALFTAQTDEEMDHKATGVGVLSTQNPDVRSLRELLIYGIKGMAAYAHHAAVLGYRDAEIPSFMAKALISTTQDHSVDEMVGLVLEAGKFAVQTMALLDKANTETYGNPEITEVNIGVRNNPGILISGHDLKDLQQLLEQTKGTGVDVYTHSEMLPAHSYPKFKGYDHFVGNYGNAWWKQSTEFATFNGPIIMTTNCITPVRKAYKDRIFTTSVVGYAQIPHIPTRANGTKDFSEVIALAKTCPPPQEIEQGSIVGGFAHNQVLALADKVVGAIKAGAIKRFVVMGGCDGRHTSRSYFTEVAQQLPKDTVILTAGCAKYRYNKLDLGDIGGIPRVLDAGQCNDSYSLAFIALKLKEVFGLEDINELPISYDIAWYEQKAVTVLLALLHLGVKGIRLGPSLPAFLSPNVVKVLVDNFNIRPAGDAAEDVQAIMAGA